MLKMYLNTKYFLQMYLNTKYIDVFNYFLNTFVNTFLYYFQNIVLIHPIYLYTYKSLVILLACLIDCLRPCVRILDTEWLL